MEAAIARMLQSQPEELSDDEFPSGSGEDDEEVSGSSAGEDDDSADEGQPAAEGDESDKDKDNEGDINEDGEEEIDQDDDDDDDDDDAGAAADTEGGAESSGEEGGSSKPGRGFLEGGKSDAFAKAFSKIMETAEERKALAEGEAPILAGSKSIAKRKAEEAEAAKHDREAKRLRMEMKQRGHVVPTKRGQDPAADAREKGLQRLATRGVVRLFNAIAKAQKQLRDAAEQTGNKAKVAKLGRASFLAELKGRNATSAGAGGKSEVLVPLAPGGQVATAAAEAAQQQRPQQAQQQRRQAAGDGSGSDEEGAARWDVLQKGFVGLQGGNKMKDWDKQVSDGEDSPGGEVDDDSEEGGW